MTRLRTNAIQNSRWCYGLDPLYRRFVTGWTLFWELLYMNALAEKSPNHPLTRNTRNSAVLRRGAK